MPLSRAEIQRRYRQRLKQKAKAVHGQKCSCGANAEEMAHIAPTGLKGEGRGGKERYQDWIKNADKYVPKCRECHLKMDRGDLPPLEEVI